MKKVTIAINEDLYNSLRITSIHNQVDVDATIVELLKQYYETRKKD